MCLLTVHWYMFYPSRHFYECLGGSEEMHLPLTAPSSSLYANNLSLICLNWQEGDRIGLIRNSNGCLHYYINGMDQGLAASNCPSPVWGVVDLYGMAVKVTILDRQDPSYPNNPPAPERRANSLFRHYPDLYDEEPLEGIMVVFGVFLVLPLAFVCVFVCCLFISCLKVNKKKKEKR